MEKKLAELLRVIAAKKTENFAGIGLIIYDSGKLEKLPLASLRPRICFPDNLLIGDQKTIDFLLDISARDHSCHDGYHLFDENGKLTHISQYLGAPIVPGVKADIKGGARYLSAMYGSCLEGVYFVGLVNGHNTLCYIKNGRVYKIKAD